MCHSHTASKCHSHCLRSCPRWKQLSDLPEFMGFPGSSVVKNPPAHARDTGDMSLIPRLGRSPRGGNGNPLKYSCLENSMDRGAWQDTVHGISKSQRDWECTSEIMKLLDGTDRNRIPLPSDNGDASKPHQPEGCLKEFLRKTNKQTNWIKLFSWHPVWKRQWRLLPTWWTSPACLGRIYCSAPPGGTPVKTWLSKLFNLKTSSLKEFWVG